MFKYLLVFFLFLYNINSSKATVWTASGCPATWSNSFPWPFWNGATQLNAQPAAGDQLVIPAGCTVNVSGQPVSVTNSITLVVNGQLNFGNSNKLRLAAGSIVTVGSAGSFNAGNGGGNNNYIDIGTTAVWTAAVGDVSGPFTISSGCVLTSAGPPAQFSPAGCGTAVLPVELTDFSAECVSKGVQLNWSTISEENNDFFLIESSKDGLNWTEIAKVKGAGTVGYFKKYIHTDFNSDNGLKYYRLSQVDFDKTKKTLRVIDLNCNNVKNEMILFPNPSSTELNILLNVSEQENNGLMKLYNLQGQVVFENQIQLIEGSNSFSFPIELQPGTYHAVFSSDKVNIPSQKIIIVKP